jgi:predicted transcriptional regulator of viral defense system
MNRSELERVVFELVEGQWGLLTAAQARAAGVSRVQLTRLAEAEVLVRLAHGVYVLRGAASMDHLELRAAWLGLDPERMAADRLRNPTQGAVVSHASAARLHQLGDLEADRHEFTLPMRKQTGRSDVRLHRAVLTAGDVMTVAGLPVTRPERIIVDLLADRHDGEQVARVLASAVRSREIDLEQLAPLLSPFSARFGLPAAEGGLVLEYLLELGGVADQVIADDLVRAARANNMDVVEMVGMFGAWFPSPAALKLMHKWSAPSPATAALMQKLSDLSPAPPETDQKIDISGNDERSSGNPRSDDEIEGLRV